MYFSMKSSNKTGYGSSSWNFRQGYQEPISDSYRWEALPICKFSEIILCRNIETVQVTVFWIVTKCRNEVGYQRFGEPCCLHLQGEPKR
jgi:hypothetical protein